MGELSPEMDVEAPIWRVWDAAGVSLRELQLDWSYVDIMKASAFLDLKEAYELAAEGLQPEGE